MFQTHPTKLAEAAEIRFHTKAAKSAKGGFLTTSKR